MPTIVLVHPEIPHNTGAIGRTCVALDMELVLIRPYGFTLSDRQLKRAGLDYWQHVRLAEILDWDAFLDERAPRDDQLFLFEDDAPTSFYEPDYPDDAYLVFGSETAGLPDAIRQRHADRQFCLPMRSKHIRSLNLANTVTAAAYQALRGRF
ncbi:tRNA (cytidine(34)-2'-O)-methyltransferase [Aurantiacibacter gangjinensis]|uniref:tRNA (cytidine(34)-2'-O)-methyltransferase n=1 Tax=Aurantiacibacter gangjinensis TaxID=502682 RepID=A0A0G9MS04_9SPHN|nr:tRNA (cytidine(34)-2'-O)-methyltransferase [Aurantiacibacter gangjinensis]APE27088.1 tRNA (cytidine(34)-2'-O)-methyltransferase [Aurantiacibacter gangjinensis]KLE33507.1 tRNA methyltransferase [Aurantiacibacter gangjinensis]